jgi:hypothetical protein
MSNCHEVVGDWHIEWYKAEGPLLFNGLAAMDCPLCGQPVGFHRGKIGTAPPGVPLVRRYAGKAAEWAPLGAKYAGGTLKGYVSTAGPGSQYANYWTPQQVQQADSEERAKDAGAVTMAILTVAETQFLDVFLHEATTSPFFSGPATKALYALGVEYRDISYLAWAYQRDVPPTAFGWGHSADVAPPLPWTNREAVLRRNQELKRMWEQERKAVGSPF